MMSVFHNFAGLKTPVLKPFTINEGARQMLLATFYFAMMNIFVKAVSHLPTMEVVFFRCGISLAICLYLLHKENVDWRGSNRKLLFLRGVFGTISLYAYFVTLAHMPLGTAVTIQYMSPIFTTILALVILDEKVRPVTWVFYLVSFAGVFVMRGFNEQIELVYVFIGVLSAIGSASAYVTIRTIKNLEHPLVVVLHFQLLGTITGLTFSATNFVLPQGLDWLYLLLVGIFTQLGQVSMTRSYQSENVSTVSILVYTGVIYATLAGYLFFDEVYNLGTIIGMLMVIAGVGMSVIYRRRKLGV